MLWDKHFRWCEWKQDGRYKSYNHSPQEIKSQVLYSLHTPRSDESGFNGLSYQQGSITPRWFPSTWKAERRREWQRMRYSNHTYDSFFLPFPRTVAATASVITQHCRKKKLYASASTPYTITGYSVAVIKVPFQRSTHHDLFQCKHSLSRLNPRPLQQDVNGHFYDGEKEKCMQVMACAGNKMCYSFIWETSLDGF